MMIGEGNGHPLQCSCLENPRDGGAWWAAVCGVTESDTTEVTAAAAAAGNDDLGWKVRYLEKREEPEN